MQKFKPVDVITLAVIIGCFGLMAFEKGNNMVEVLMAFAAYYFGKSTSENFYHNSLPK